MIKLKRNRTPLAGSVASQGFTLVELLIAILVSTILGIAVVSNYISQERTATVVREIAEMQQQLRGAMYIMEQDIRIAGWTPDGASGFGVTNVQRWNITNETTAPAVNANGSPSLTVAYDWDPLGGANVNNGLLDDPRPAYRLFDEDGDGILSLVRDNDDPLAALDRQLVAEGIQAIGFAYAFDNNKDGQLDRSAAGNIIWAVDSDNDNELDVALDTNDDGVIDLADDNNNDYRITPLDGGGLPTPVTVDRIRMVQIWLLARARHASKEFANAGESFVVGDQVVPSQAGGFNDGIRRRILVRAVQCRNAGLF